MRKRKQSRSTGRRRSTRSARRRSNSLPAGGGAVSRRSAVRSAPSAGGDTTVRGPGRREARSAGRARAASDPGPARPVSRRDSPRPQPRSGLHSPSGRQSKIQRLKQRIRAAFTRKKGITVEELLDMMGISGPTKGADADAQESFTDEHRDNLQQLFDRLEDGDEVAERWNLIGREIAAIQKQQPTLTRRRAAMEGTRAALHRLKQQP